MARLRAARMAAAGVAVASTLASVLGTAAATRVGPDLRPEVSGEVWAASSAGDLPVFADCAEFTARMRGLAGARAVAGGGLVDNRSHQVGAESHRSTPYVESSDNRAAIGGPDAVGRSAVRTPMRDATDGRLLVSARNRVLRVVDVSGTEPRYRGAVALPGTGRSSDLVILSGRRAVVIGPADLGPVDEFSRKAVRPDNAPPPDHTTDITVVDLTDPARPRILSSEAVTARYVTAQAVGATVRLVLATDPERRMEDAEPAEATAAAWLPHRQIRDGQGKLLADGPLLGCRDVRRPRTDSGMDLLSVLTVDPRRRDALTGAHATGVLASGDLVAASVSRLFIATVIGWGREQRYDPKHPAARPASAGPRSSVHVYDITKARATYLSSTPVAEYITGQEAMSARGHALRLVTTSWPPWWFVVTPTMPAFGYAVTVLREQGGALRTAGGVEEIARGRRLAAIRWFDDLLAVTPTYKKAPDSYYTRQGPLRLVNLREPARPALGGALDLPHDAPALLPLSRGLLAGIDNRGSASRGRSAEVFVLDVTDPGEPRPSDRVSYGRGRFYGVQVVELGGDTVLLTYGRTIAGSKCPAGVRCVSEGHPGGTRPPGCPPSPPDGTTGGVGGFRIDRDERLQPLCWFHGVDPILLAADRLVAITDHEVTFLDAALRPLGSTQLPGPPQ